MTPSATPDFGEHDVVVLRRDLPDDGLVTGQAGTVVGVYASGGYEVEFTTADGAAVVVTLTGQDIEHKHV